MRTGTTISAAAHVGVLLWAVLVFDVKPLDNAGVESIPVDFISATEFSKMTEGVRNAPKQQEPKPLVEKQGEKRPVLEQSEKLTEKQEIVTPKEAPPVPPTPEPKKAEPKPEPAPKPEKAEQKNPQPKADPIAEALKKEEKKKPDEKPAETKTAEAKPVPLPQKKPPKPQPPKFDPAQVAALLDKRDPQRRAATGDTINRTASLGAPGANAPELSQSELDALRARLIQLWNPPIGIRNAADMVIRVRVLLRPDGTLAGPPAVLTSGHGPMFESARDSAVRAIFRGQPFDMLRPQTYETWKDIEVTFDPRDMLFRG
jgi:outer membrane biosynthesis protein TonB